MSLAHETKKVYNLLEYVTKEHIATHMGLF